MKKNTYIHYIILVLLLTGCNKNDDKFEVSGTVNNSNDSIIKLEYKIQDSTYLIEDKIKNNQFAFKGNSKKLSFGSIFFRNGIPAYFLIVPNSQTKISIQDDKTKIESTSSFTNLYNQYSTTKNQKTKDSIIKVFSKKFADEDIFAEMVLGWISRSKPIMDNQKKIKKLLNESNNDSDKMELIMAYFERNEVTQVGNTIPNLSYINELSQNKNIINSTSKYTLIDFWATWCKPCKWTNEYLVHYKDQLADNGISITSVSIEKNIDKWKKGSLSENISWNSLIDTTKNSMDVLKFKQIPFSLLVNKEGEIIISDLKVKDIEELAINGI